MNYQIEPATTEHITTIQQIEVEAGERFASVGLADIAEAEPPTVEALAAYVRAGTAWVATVHGTVVGYATASVVDNEGHLDQVSVTTSAAGHEVGRALIDGVHRWAISEGFETITLTTFARVAWNGPYYERLGYVAMDHDELGPELAAIRSAEIAAGLDVSPRVAMRCQLSGVEAAATGQAREDAGPGNRYEENNNVRSRFVDTQHVDQGRQGR